MKNVLSLLLLGAIGVTGVLAGCGSGEPEPTKESFAPRPRPDGYNPGAAGAPSVKPPTGP